MKQITFTLKAEKWDEETVSDPLSRKTGQKGYLSHIRHLALPI